MIKNSLVSTFAAITSIADDIIKEFNENPKEYIVKAIPFGVIERIDGQEIPEELELALVKKFEL